MVQVGDDGALAEAIEDEEDESTKLAIYQPIDLEFHFRIKKSISRVSYRIFCWGG